MNVTTTQWDEQVLKSKELVLVYFWQSSCAPCLSALPMLEELQKKYSYKAKIVLLNVDESANIASIYKISIVPTTIFFKNGQKLHEIICSVSKPDLETPLQNL